MTYDLEEELQNNPAIIEKCRNDKVYAQNLYAALCNMRWQKIEVIPILKEDLWSCTWRYAGGLVAGLRNQNEDYLNWYCSGIGADEHCSGYVEESVVTDEIREDLQSLGWIPVEWDDIEPI